MLADAAGSAWFWPALVGGGVAVLALAALVLATPVYKHVMCAKYLFGGWKAVVPLVSCLPAALGVFLLILVFAIMNGFAMETRKWTRGTLSDIIVDARMEGMPYYDEFCRRIEAIDGVEAATPIVRTYGVVRVKPTTIPLEPLVQPCLILGVRPAEKVKMGRFRECLKRQKVTPEKDTRDPPEEVQEQAFPAADLLRVPRSWAEATGGPERPGCIPGVGLVTGPYETLVPEEVPVGAGRRVGLAAGAIAMLAVTLLVWQAARRRPGRAGWRAATALCAVTCLTLAGAAIILPVHEETTERKQVVDYPLLRWNDTLVVSTIPVNPSGAIATEPGGLPKVQSRAFVMVDMFKSGFWEADSQYIYVDFDVAQAMAGMTGDDETPARANQVQVRTADAAAGPDLCAKIRQAWEDLLAEKGLVRAVRPDVKTWEEQQHMILTVVQIERNVVALMLSAMFLGFGVLIGLISYVMAYIKSRDVGILKALGARDAGVGSLFLGYGFIIGLIGVSIGLTGALLMLHYLDAIEIWVNNTLGIDVFPREFYYFEHIPRNISPAWCVGVSLGVLALSTIASAVGGLLAALKQPVEALRYE